MPLIQEAFESEVRKDAFHLDTVFELLNIIKDLHTSAGDPKAPGQSHSLEKLHAAYRKYVPTIGSTVERVRPLLEPATGKRGDAAALLKTCAEVLLLAGE